jgi:hypothetical protein
MIAFKEKELSVISSCVPQMSLTSVVWRAITGWYSPFKFTFWKFREFCLFFCGWLGTKSRILAHQASTLPLEPPTCGNLMRLPERVSLHVGDKDGVEKQS